VRTPLPTIPSASSIVRAAMTRSALLFETDISLNAT